jgi:hypothetical protein
VKKYPTPVFRPIIPVLTFDEVSIGIKEITKKSRQFMHSFETSADGETSLASHSLIVTLLQSWHQCHAKELNAGK